MPSTKLVMETQGYQLIFCRIQNYIWDVDAENSGIVLETFRKSQNKFNVFFKNKTMKYSPYSGKEASTALYFSDVIVLH